MAYSTEEVKLFPLVHIMAPESCPVALPVARQLSYEQSACQGSQVATVLACFIEQSGIKAFVYYHKSLCRTKAAHILAKMRKMLAKLQKLCSGTSRSVTQLVWGLGVGVNSRGSRRVGRLRSTACRNPLRLMMQEKTALGGLWLAIGLRGGSGQGADQIVVCGAVQAVL